MTSKPVYGVVFLAHPKDLDLATVQQHAEKLLPVYKLYDEADTLLASDYQYTAVGSVAGLMSDTTDDQVPAVVAWKLDLPDIISAVCDSFLIGDAAPKDVVVDALGSDVIPLAPSMFFMHEEVLNDLRDLETLSLEAISAVSIKAGHECVIPVDAVIEAALKTVQETCDAEEAEETAANESD